MALSCPQIRNGGTVFREAIIIERTPRPIPGWVQPIVIGRPRSAISIVRRTCLQLRGGVHLSYMGFPRPRLFPVVEESEEDLDAFEVIFPAPLRRHRQVRMRTKSFRHSHAPSGLDLGEENTMDPTGPCGAPAY
jgi:hypothetical protein